jgi:hypothetical protein
VVLVFDYEDHLCHPQPTVAIARREEKGRFREDEAGLRVAGVCSRTEWY